jgi:hypothetical protein
VISIYIAREGGGVKVKVDNVDIISYSVAQIFKNKEGLKLKT